jgi:hypothetical protein
MRMRMLVTNIAATEEVDSEAGGTGGIITVRCKRRLALVVGPLTHRYLGRRELCPHFLADKTSAINLIYMCGSVIYFRRETCGS